MGIKFAIKRTGYYFTHLQEFKTLEELLSWCKTQNHEIIISEWKDEFKGEKFEWRLEIYDDYRE